MNNERMTKLSFTLSPGPKPKPPPYSTSSRVAVSGT